jgi:hypothetical protein
MKELNKNTILTGVPVEDGIPITKTLAGILNGKFRHHHLTWLFQH